ncbi:hypothetical protein E4T56_gene17975 [Termitomyces sp. T112]|nr:hypothetical protein E4T56_gene17975 [Termitomyces sp. T112]
MITRESFPYELQDLVIGYLWEDLQSLALCSLVSSRWLGRARKLYFAHFLVSIEVIRVTDETLKKTTELKELLEAPHSRLGRHIQRLQIIGLDETFDRDPRFLPSMQEMWDELSSELRTLLPHFPNVGHLTVWGTTWKMIARDVQIQIGSLSKVVSLAWKEVHFDALDELILFASENFLELEKLEVERLGVTKDFRIGPSLPAQDPKRFAHLRNLKLYAEPSAAPLLTSNIVPIQMITTLHVEVRHLSIWSTLGSALKTIGSALTSLRLDIRMNVTINDLSYDIEDVDFPISLCKNVNLKSLQFEPLFEIDTWWFGQVLDTMSELHVLEEIRFGFLPVIICDYRSLERVLLRRKANYSKVVWECQEKDCYYLSETLAHFMPELFKHGLLSLIHVREPKDVIGQRTWRRHFDQ